MKQKTEYDVFFNNKPELLLHSLYYFSTRFPSVKAEVQEMLGGLEDILNEVMAKMLPARTAKKFEAFRELLGIVKSSILDFYDQVASRTP